MRPFLLFFGVWTAALAQSSPRNQVTFGGGWARQLNVPSYVAETATALQASYGYRVIRYIQVEAGVVAALQPSPDLCSAHGCSDPDDRFIWIPFGVRFVAPLWHGRLELSAGGGGTYEKYSVSNGDRLPCCIRSLDGWGGYFAGGGAVALDPGRHWWLGASPRWFLANPTAGQHDRWFVIPLEFSWRF
jgi:hypothetical protein